MKNILNKIKIDYSTYILILLAVLAGYMKHAFLILLIVIVHEIGHVFFFKIYNITIERIVIYPFGGMTYINKKIHERIYRDVLISLGGVIFQFLLWGIMYFIYVNSFIAFSTYNIFLNYNISIIFFNLLPLVPLDGSKLFFSFFTKYFSYKLSYLLMIVLGFISLILFVVFTFTFKMNDFVIICFLVSSLFKIIKEYRMIMNKFYLERLIYDNYYDGICNGDYTIDEMRIDKYYYFMKDNKYINERDYLLRNRY